MSFFSPLVSHGLEVVVVVEVKDDEYEVWPSEACSALLPLTSSLLRSYFFQVLHAKVEEELLFQELRVTGSFCCNSRAPEVLTLVDHLHPLHIFLHNSLPSLPFLAIIILSAFCSFATFGHLSVAEKETQEEKEREELKGFFIFSFSISYFSSLFHIFVFESKLDNDMSCCCFRLRFWNQESDRLFVSLSSLLRFYANDKRRNPFNVIIV